MRPVNEVRRVVTVYPYDPAEAYADSLTDTIAAGLQGHSGTVYVGDKGDPGRRFDGLMVADRPAFHGAAYLGGGMPLPDLAGRDFTNARSEDVLEGDPAARILAARLARRRS
jgi:hypothetical protein